MINNNNNFLKIAILLCAYNGEKYILEQLDSIKNQTYSDWKLYISDDSSTDDTVNVIYSWIKDNNYFDKVKIYAGPNLGFANNFLFLTSNKEIEADLLFWADQDDIWLPEKVSKVIEIILAQDNKLPVLYCGRTILIDQNNVQYGLSPLQNKYIPSFGNALLQSLGGGNTMAFNSQARDLISLGYKHEMPSHDWWAYLIVSGNGGCVIYDDVPFIRYRQHENNIIGSNFKFGAKVERFTLILKGLHKVRINKNIKVLLLNSNYLTGYNCCLLKDFISIRNSFNFIKKIFLFKKYKIRRQNDLLTFILLISFMFNKL
jgi:glycosyltransferase involved in cell wall biosynthesis